MGTRSLTRVIPIDGDKLLGEKRKVTEDTLKKSVQQTFKDIARYVVKHTKSGKATDSLINLYRQYDGHMYGHGLELAKFLDGFTLVNGIRSDINPKDKIANGSECLSAQLVKHFKKDAGQFYLMPFKDEVGAYSEEYIYNIYVIHFTLSATDTRFVMNISVTDTYKEEDDPEKYIFFQGTDKFLKETTERNERMKRYN